MSYKEALQRIANEFFSAEPGKPATAREIAAWALDQGLWQPQRGEVIALCARDVARAMREEYITDPQGRRVRSKHAARVEREGKQETLWADIREADRAHMEIAFQQRRNQILGECRQLKVDVDSYNENVAPAEPIQMVFDFTLDLEELEALAA